MKVKIRGKWVWCNGLHDEYPDIYLIKRRKYDVLEITSSNAIQAIRIGKNVFVRKEKKK